MFTVHAFPCPIRSKLHFLPFYIVVIGAAETEEQRAQNKILKGLLDVEDDKTNVFSKLVEQTQAGQQRLAAQQRGGDSKNDNPMLMHLLNHDDENMDNRTTMRNSELLRQLQKEEPKDHQHHAQVKTLANEELMQRLRFQGNDFTRKRPLADGDDGPSAKRGENKPSKLCEKNKMLASLLSNPTKPPAPLPPALKVFPDIPRGELVDL